MDQAIPAGAGGTEKMIIRLPWPDPRLMPNRAAGKHWGTVSGLKAKAKGDAYTLTKVAGKGQITDFCNRNIPVSLLFCTPDGRHRDVDNLLASQKSALDGIALALGVNDARFRPVLIDWIRGPDKVGAVIVAVGVSISSGVNLA